MAIAKRVHAEQQSTVQGAAGGDFRVRTKAVFQPVAEQQFVSEYFLHAIENGLTRDISLSRNGESTLARDRTFGRHWIHSFYIGAATAELQGRQVPSPSAGREALTVRDLRGFRGVSEYSSCFRVQNGPDGRTSRGPLDSFPPGTLAGEERISMLWTIFVILLIMWLLGFSFHIAGSLVHLLLVVALIVLIVNLISGRRGVV